MSACAELCEFACQLTLETGAPPHRLMPLVRRLRRLATSHLRRCETQCNGCRTCQGAGYVIPGSNDPGLYHVEKWLPAQESEKDARPCPTCSTDTLEDAIRGVCRELTELREANGPARWPGSKRGGEFVPVFQRDPRGATVRLRLPSGAFDTLGGAENGWGVPTSR